MFCPYCGNPCAENHKFCFRCGKTLPEVTAGESIPESTPSAMPLPDNDPMDAVSTAAAAFPAEDTTLTAFTDPASVPTASSDGPAPLPTKGRLWPPILVLCLMIGIGLAAFFLMPRTPEPAKSCFTVESGVLYFDYSLYTGPEELTVPDTVDGVTVTGISRNCFADCDGLTTIILPETLTIIGDKAFAGCDALRGIYIPNGVLSIGAGALAQCPALEAVYLPGSLTDIGDGFLDECPGLQYILFDGTYSQWRDLYNGIFKNRVELHTKDGVYQVQP